MSYVVLTLSLIVLLPLAQLTEPIYQCGAGGGQLAYSAGGLKLLDTATGEVTTLVEIGDSSIDGFAWSPNGARIAFETNRGGTWGIYSIGVTESGEARGEPYATFDSPAAEYNPLWSPNGYSIAYYRDDGLYIASEDPIVWSLVTAPYPDTDVFWTPDSSVLVYALATDSGWVIESNSGQQNRRELASGEGRVYLNDMSPDGVLLFSVQAVPGGAAQIFTLDTTSGKMTDLETLGAAPVWSPGSTRIAYIPWQSDTSGDTEIAVMDGNGANKEVVSGDFRHHIWGRVSWSPDGRYLAFSVFEEGYADNVTIHTLDTETHQVQVFRDTLLNDSPPQWRPCAMP